MKTRMKKEGRGQEAPTRQLTSFFKVWPIGAAIAAIALFVPAGIFAQEFVFVSNQDGNSEIYTIKADGSGRTNLTNNPAPDTNPRWSPDGTKILFISERDGNQEIYMMNADGSGQTNLTKNAADDVMPQWSPDGSRILFRSGRDGVGGIYVMNADGTSLTQLANVPEVVRTKWSPNSDRILFTTVAYVNNLYVANADGSSVQKWWDSPGDGANNPQWSPDGTKIILSSDNDDLLQIYVISGPGVGRNRLRYGSGVNDLSPQWSSDGTRIAFSSVQGGYMRIYVMNADGSGRTQLTNRPGLGELPEEGEVQPEWSPDDSKILFTTYGRNVSKAKIYVMNADGSSLLDIASLGEAYSPDTAYTEVSWSPDGSRLFAPFGAMVKADGRDLVTLGVPGDRDFQAFGDFSVDPTPSISDGGIVLANLLPVVSTVSPLSMISIFGTAFSAGSVLHPSLDAGGKIETVLGGTCVEIGGERSSIFAMTPKQANVQTPGTPRFGPVSVVVVRNCDRVDEVRSGAATVTFEEATPAFFLLPPYADDGLIAARFNADFAVVAPAGVFSDQQGPSRPAVPGDIIVLFGTGWGPTTAGLGTGELAAGAAELLPAANPMVTFGGIPVAAQNLLYAGATPGTAGLYQLAIRVPVTAMPGNNQVVLTVYGRSTPVGPVVAVAAP